MNHVMIHTAVQLAGGVHVIVILGLIELFRVSSARVRFVESVRLSGRLFGSDGVFSPFAMFVNFKKKKMDVKGRGTTDIVQ